MNYGETTKKFLLFLKENGPQTIRQLENQEFWPGIRSRVDVLVKQGRVEKIKIENPYSYYRSHNIVTAIKLANDLDLDPQFIGHRYHTKKTNETYRDRINREKKARAVNRAIILLEQQGYTVTPPIIHPSS